jgi:hypothetical protein
VRVRLQKKKNLKTFRIREESTFFLETANVLHRGKKGGVGGWVGGRCCFSYGCSLKFFFHKLFGDFATDKAATRSSTFFPKCFCKVSSLGSLVREKIFF